MYLGLGYRMAGMKRALEPGLLGFGKREETVVKPILKTASYCFGSMRSITGINSESFEIVIKNKRVSLARRVQQPGVCQSNLIIWVCTRQSTASGCRALAFILF